MKAIIYKYERYPDYGVYEEKRYESHYFIDIPDDLYQRYVKADTEYNLVQQELARLYEQRKL